MLHNIVEVSPIVQLLEDAGDKRLRVDPSKGARGDLLNEFLSLRLCLSVLGLPTFLLLTRKGKIWF